jgi:hypothetical protein
MEWLIQDLVHIKMDTELCNALCAAEASLFCVMHMIWHLFSDCCFHSHHAHSFMGWQQCMLALVCAAHCIEYCCSRRAAAALVSCVVHLSERTCECHSLRAEAYRRSVNRSTYRMPGFVAAMCTHQGGHNAFHCVVLDTMSDLSRVDSGISFMSHSIAVLAISTGTLVRQQRVLALVCAAHGKVGFLETWRNVYGVQWPRGTCFS